MKDLQNTKLINLKGTQGFKGKQGPVVEQHPKSDHSNFSRNSRSITKEILYLPQLGLTRVWVDKSSSTTCSTFTRVLMELLSKGWIIGRPRISSYSPTYRGDALSGRNSGKGNIKTSCLDLRKLAMWRKSSLSSYCFSKSVNKKTKFLFKIRNVLSYLQSSSVDEALDQLGKFDGKSEEGYLLGYSTSSKGFRVYNRVTRKVQECLHVNFLENQENQKGKGQSLTLVDVEDLDDQQFIVHTAQPMHPEERTAAKRSSIVLKNKLHDEAYEFGCIKKSLAKAHNDDQRIAFEEEKRRISIAKGKEHVNSTFILSTANTPPQSTGNTPTDSDDDIPKDASGFEDPAHPNKVLQELSRTFMGGGPWGQKSDPRCMVYVDDIFSLDHSFMVKDFEELCKKNYSKPDHTIDALKSLGKNEGMKLQEDVISWKKIVSWQCKKQTCVLSLSTEAEYVAAEVVVPQDRLQANLRDWTLLFDDEHGVDSFPKQLFGWDLLRDIGYEGNLAQLTFSKPLFSPQWKYLVHVLLHCLSPKSTSWEQFGTNIASALVGLATNQKFNFSLMILTGMLGHISNGTPFLMYPRFVQLFLNKQLEGVDRPQDFIPSVSLPSKVFTFMRKHSPKFSCRITPLTPSMLEVVTALAAEEEHSTSPHSRAASSARDAQGTPTHVDAHSQRSASVQGYCFFWYCTPYSDAVQVLIPYKGTAAISRLYMFNMEVKRLKRQTLSQAKQIIQLKAKLKKLSKFVQPVVKHHAFWVENQNLKKQKRRRKKHKKKVSSVKLGRNKDEGTLSEEHHRSKKKIQHILSLIDFIDKRCLERRNGRLDLETTQVLLERVLLLPRTLNFAKNESRPREHWRLPNDEEVARKIQAEWDAEEERKRFEELKKTKPKTTLRKPTSLAQERNQMMNFLKGQGYKNLQKLKYPQMKELYDKVQASIKDSFKDFIPMDSEKEREMLKEREAKRLLRKRKATIAEEQPSKKPKLRTETIDALRNYLRVVDFEKNAQDRESLEGISMITELQDLYHLYRVVDDYYEHIPPTGLGLTLLGDLNIIWETAESSDDDFWKDQEEWEIIRWRFHESSGVHTLEIEDGTMIHMLAERRYPLSRELMIRMLDHGMEVEEETETAITLIHLFILWTTEDGDNS
ncbi:hypothetical protein Tco_0520537 [Tanacetum coccineum]